MASSSGFGKLNIRAKDETEEQQKDYANVSSQKGDNQFQNGDKQQNYDETLSSTQDYQSTGITKNADSERQQEQQEQQLKSLKASFAKTQNVGQSSASKTNEQIILNYLVHIMEMLETMNKNQEQIFDLIDSITETSDMMTIRTMPQKFSQPTMVGTRMSQKIPEDIWFGEEELIEESIPPVSMTTGRRHTTTSNGIYNQTNKTSSYGAGGYTNYQMQPRNMQQPIDYAGQSYHTSDSNYNFNSQWPSSTKTRPSIDYGRQSYNTSRMPEKMHHQMLNNPIEAEELISYDINENFDTLPVRQQHGSSVRYDDDTQDYAMKNSNIKRNIRRGDSLEYPNLGLNVDKLY